MAGHQELLSGVFAVQLSQVGAGLGDAAYHGGAGGQAETVLASCGVEEQSLAVS